MQLFSAISRSSMVATDPGKAPASDPLEGQGSWSMPWMPSARRQAVSDNVKAGQ